MSSDRDGELTKLQADVPVVITYRCRDIGYGVEEGVIAGRWTGEIDSGGKRTIHALDGGPTVYLFDDEIVTVNLYPYPADTASTRH